MRGARNHEDFFENAARSSAAAIAYDEGFGALHSVERVRFGERSRLAAAPFLRQGDAGFHVAGGRCW